MAVSRGGGAKAARELGRGHQRKTTLFGAPWGGTSRAREGVRESERKLPGQKHRRTPVQPTMLRVKHHVASNAKRHAGVFSRTLSFVMNICVAISAHLVT